MMEEKNSQLVSAIVETVLDVLKKRRRLDLLPDIISSLQKFYSIKKQTAIISVATDLSPEDKEKILRILRQKLGVETQAEFIVDPTLIGGYSIKIQDMRIDNSIKGQLDSLQETLL